MPEWWESDTGCQPHWTEMDLAAYGGQNSVRCSTKDGGDDNDDSDTDDDDDDDAYVCLWSAAELNFTYNYNDS